MSTARKIAFVIGAAMALAWAVSRAQEGGPDAFPIEEVAPGNFAHYARHHERTAANLGDTGNSGFVVGERCVAAIDAGGSAAVGRSLRAAIRRVTALPVCYVILTHVHPDHFFGASAFAADRPRIVVHANFPAQMAARSRNYLNSLHRDLGPAADGSEIVVPDLLVSDRLDLDLGGRTLNLRAWPPAHTDDDLTVYDAATGTFWVSDLLFVGHTPVIDGTITGFLSVIAALRELPARQFVPGHGRGGSGWPSALDAQERYLRAILDQTRAAIRARRTIQQAADEVGREEAERWAAFDLYHRRNVITAYTELEWD